MNHTSDHDPRPAAAVPTVDPTSGGPARRRWLPATALIGGVLGAGLLLTTTADASDDGGTGTTTTAPSAAPSAPGAPGAGLAPDGTTITPPADGAAPTPPADGAAPTPPAPPAGGPGRGAHGGPMGGPAADGSTSVTGIVAASSDTGITVRSDGGDSVSATFTDDTRFGPAGPKSADGGTAPAETTAADLTLGSRVEIRVLDDEIVSARLVVAHVDGTLTALSGSDGTVTTREGLRIAVDLSGVTTTATVGDQVRITGAVDDAGTTVIATSAEVAAAQ